MTNRRMFLVDDPRQFSKTLNNPQIEMSNGPFDHQSDDPTGNILGIALLVGGITLFGILGIIIYYSIT